MIQGKKKKWSFYRRVIAYVLAAAMFVSILPAQSLVVYAADTTYAGNFDSPIDETDITNKTLERGFELKLVGKKTGVNTTFASSISEKSDHFGSYTVNSSDRLSAEIVPEIKTYNIWVAGIQITEFNQADVLRLLFTPYIYILVKVT